MTRARASGSRYCTQAAESASSESGMHYRLCCIVAAWPGPIMTRMIISSLLTRTQAGRALRAGPARGPSAPELWLSGRGRLRPGRHDLRAESVALMMMMIST